MPATASKLGTQTTTVRLPRRLYEEARELVEQGCTNASSLNELLVEALRNRLKQVRRANIDAEFAEMRHDAQYHRESQVIANQFATNDRDTLRSAEKVNR
jgi:Arc/MetJ-type ribon-helix-helix transcriptional regulator